MGISISDQTQRAGITHNMTTGLLMCAGFLLAGCGGGSGGGGTGAATQQDIPAAFDTAARALSAQAYPLASCVAIADDKQKLDCYAALGFKGKGDIARVEALAGSADVLAGKHWQITAPSPGGSDSFQGMAVLTLAALPNEGAMAFRNTRLTLQCPATWGGPSNQEWGASVDLPFDVAYESNSKVRGSMVIDIDGKAFNAVQFSRSSFKVASDQAIAFRDAATDGKNLSFVLKTADGKTGSTKTTLPNDAVGLKGYFAKFCS